MNEGLQRNLSKVLEYLEQGGALIAKETPLLLQEILIYYTYYYGLVLLVSVLVLVCYLIYLPKGIIKLQGDVSDSDAVLPIVTLVGGAIISLICFLNIIHDTTSFLKVLFAPRLFLLEKVTGMLLRIVN